MANKKTLTLTKGDTVVVDWEINTEDKGIVKRTCVYKFHNALPTATKGVYLVQFVKTSTGELTGWVRTDSCKIKTETMLEKITIKQ